MTSEPIANARTRLGRRLLIDFAVGVGIVVVLGLVLLFSIRTGFDITGGWFGFVGFTPFVFWTVLKSQRRNWRRRGFWMVIGLCFLLHLAVFITILLKYPELRLVWFAPLSVVEIALLTTGLVKLFDLRGTPRA